MKFKITTARHYYRQDDIARLSKIGIALKRDKYDPSIYHKAFDDTIDDRNLPEIEIGSLEELIEIMVEYGGVIIEPPNKITIYDDYVE